MQVIPALDILDGAAVRLLRGDYAQVTVYDPDPVGLGQRWSADGAAMVHIVDLDAARGRERSAMATVRGLVDAGVACQVGGGIRTPADASELIDAGAARVVVGSAFVDPDGQGDEIAAAVGPDRVVAAIDVRDDLAKGHGWVSGGVAFRDVVGRALRAGVERMLVTAISVDGTMEGPDLELLRDVGSIDAAIRVIASGGVGSIEDIRSLAGERVEAVVVGRALYERRFTVADAIEVAASGAP